MLAQKWNCPLSIHLSVSLLTTCNLKNSPSSFLRRGSLLMASSLQFPSAECFSSSGLPTNNICHSCISIKKEAHVKGVGLFALNNGVRFATCTIQFLNENEKRNRPRIILSTSGPTTPTHVFNSLSIRLQQDFTVCLSGFVCVKWIIILYPLPTKSKSSKPGSSAYKQRTELLKCQKDMLN